MNTLHFSIVWEPGTAILVTEYISYGRPSFTKLNSLKDISEYFHKSSKGLDRILGELFWKGVIFLVAIVVIIFI